MANTQKDGILMSLCWALEHANDARKCVGAEFDLSERVRLENTIDRITKDIQSLIDSIDQE